MPDLQRTAEWFQARCGCLTASRAGDACARTKAGKPTAAWQALVDELVTERITGSCVTHMTTAAMQWGIEHEDEARAAYEVASGNLVELTGFWKHPEIEWLGASPDGLIGEDGLVEIKCPSSTTHIARVMAQTVPDEYKPQMCLQLLCTGRKWCDFVDYDPRMQGAFEAASLMVVRYEPSEDELQTVLDRCLEVLAKVDEQMDLIKNLIQEKKDGKRK